jgi:hypothetical protein
MGLGNLAGPVLQAVHGPQGLAESADSGEVSGSIRSPGDVMRSYVLPLICIVALAGCGRNTNERTVTVPGSNGGTVTISGNGQHFSATDANGHQSVDINSGGNGAPPANMPSFVPVYPGAKVTASVVGSGDKGNGGMIVIETSASIADVVAFYKQKTAASGFAETMNMNVNGTTMSTQTSADKKKTVSIVASVSNGTTHAQITWGTN